MGNLRIAKIHRIKGSLSTKEINQQRLWLRRVQGIFKIDDGFEEHCLQQHQNNNGLHCLQQHQNNNARLECRGQIDGDYRRYVSDSHLFADKLVTEAYQNTLHRGICLTMGKVWEQYWVPRLQHLTKKVVKKCHGFKRCNVQAFVVSPPGQLLKDRTEGQSAFKVIRVDFAGLLRYRKKKNLEGKAYIALYTCSLTSGIYLDLLLSLETREFLISLKRFIARHGRLMNIRELKQV